MKGQVQELQLKLHQALEKIMTTEEKIEESTERLGHLECAVRADRVEDILAFADQCERSDFASNLLKANCVLITGE